MTRKDQQPGWVVILSTEARRLWLGWQGPLLLAAFSLFLSIYTVLLALDPEINVLSPRTMTNQTLQVTILIGIVVVLLLSANAISGERDRRSLESMLLTPLPWGQIAAGKVLAAFSLWLGMIPMAIPYLLVVAKGTDAAVPAAALLIFSGSLLVALCAALGILVSALASSNLVSFSLSFAAILLLAAPSQLPGSVQDLPFVRWFIVTNPFTAIAQFQAGVLDGGGWPQGVGLLVSPLVFLILLAFFAPGFLNRRLSLLGGLKQ